MTPCLYQITNLVNGKFYIGVHCDSANTPYMGSGTGIIAAIKKHGIENFRKDILAECQTMEFAYQLEAAVVDEAFVARNDTYNMTVGGHAPSFRGRTHTAETRARLSAASKKTSKGRRHSEEAKAKIREARARQVPPMLGKQQSETMKNKIRASHLQERQRYVDAAYRRWNA
jgi:group I intron endonuclease